jgi:cyclase
VRPLFIVSSLLVSSIAGAVPLEHVEVAPGVHVFTTAPDGYVPNGNSVVIVDADGVLVFDTFTRPSTAKSLLTEIRKLTKAPVRTIVNSHWHPDHWFGNQAILEAFPGAEVITSEETRRLLLTTAGTWKPRFEAELRKNPTDPLDRGFLEEATQVTFRFPTVTYGDQLVLYRGGREIRLMSMVGDARGTTVLWLPAQRLVATGDVLSGPVPYFTPPLGQHAQSLRKIRALEPALIVPGHGPVRKDTRDLDRELALFDAVVGQVRTATERGLITVDEVKKAVDVDSLRAGFTAGDPKLDDKFRRYVGRMVENAYREARDDKFWTE